MDPKILTLMALLLTLASFASAQGMMGGNAGPGMMGSVQATAEEVNHTKQEERGGQDILANLKSGQISCIDLTDDDFELLGESFMGQAAGDNHAAMNKRIKQMMDEAGEEQMHISLGKSYSGCYNESTTGYRGMMGRGVPLANTWGETGADYNGRPFRGYGMTGPGMMGLGYGSFSSIWTILWLGFWLLILILAVMVTYYLGKRRAAKTANEPPLGILKKRFAAGELTKDEFESMKTEIQRD